jgi:hypothetical protein
MSEAWKARASERAASRWTGEVPDEAPQLWRGISGVGGGTIVEEFVRGIGRRDERTYKTQMTGFDFFAIVTSFAF